MLAILAPILGGLGVAAGAFGAHALKSRLSPDLLEVFQTGAHYHLVHAVALTALSWSSLGQRIGASAGWVMLAGTLVFSGSLYALALTGVRKLGAVTPIGGVLLIVAWGMLAFAAAQASR